MAQRRAAHVALRLVSREVLVFSCCTVFFLLCGNLRLRVSSLVRNCKSKSGNVAMKASSLYATLEYLLTFGQEL